MKLVRRLGVLAGTAVLTVALAVPAQAVTIEETTPETPALNAELPAIHTYRASGHLKANILNPFPVCNASEDLRTVVYKVTDSFKPVGTISTSNNTDTAIPLTQTLSKTQTVTVSKNGGLSIGVGLNLLLLAVNVAATLGYDASYSLSWTVGQQIGPYQVPAGYTGEATYGFRTVKMVGTQQFCLANGTWSAPVAWSADTPVKNEVKVKMYNRASGSYGGIGTGSKVDSTDFLPVVEPAQDLTAGRNPGGKQALDLQPKLTVSSAKAKGYAGVVALRVKNVGTENYYGEFPTVSFLVKVKTESGPRGVDRLITPGYFNGAYVQDLGFDRSTSTRTFLVTASNLVPSGKTVLLANFNFGDGKTTAGRLTNTIEVTQLGRVAGDISTWNDVKMSSKAITYTDLGVRNVGIF